MPTIGFSNKTNTWNSRYSYAASNFSSVNGKFFSSPSSPSLNAQFNSPIWEHNTGDSYNSFYTSVVPSSMTVTFNKDSSTNKIFKSFSVEGTKNLVNSFSIFKTNNHIDNTVDTQVSISLIKNVNGVMYGGIGRDRDLVFGKNLMVLGAIIQGHDTGTAVKFIPANNYGAHPSFYQVTLDPSAGITPSVFHNQQFPMKIGFLTANPIGAQYRFDSQVLFNAIDLEGKSYADISASSHAVNRSLGPEGWNVEYDAIDPLRSTFNFVSPDASLASAINAQADIIATSDIPQSLYLVGLAHESFVGDDVRGTFAECKITVPLTAGYFELNAMNFEYEPVKLSHDK